MSMDGISTVKEHVADPNDPSFLDERETPESLEIFRYAVRHLERSHPDAIAALRASPEYKKWELRARETVWLKTEKHRDASETYLRQNACMWTLFTVRLWHERCGHRLVAASNLARFIADEARLSRAVDAYQKLHPGLCPRKFVHRRLAVAAASTETHAPLVRGMKKMTVSTTMKEDFLRGK